MTRALEQFALLETSGTYPGVLFHMSDAQVDAFFLAYALSGADIKKVAQTPGGVFIQDEDVALIPPVMRKKFQQTKGAFDFATDEFFKSGIRGTVKNPNG